MTTQHTWKSAIFGLSVIILLPLVLLPLYLYMQAWGGTIKGEQHLLPVIAAIYLGFIGYLYIIYKLSQLLRK